MNLYWPVSDPDLIDPKASKTRFDSGGLLILYVNVKYQYHVRMNTTLLISLVLPVLIIFSIDPEISGGR
jgi:hypothetical protein